MAKTYSVYIDPDAYEPMETVEFVEEHFNLYAFFFGIFWLVYHRLWLPLAVVVLIRGVSTALAFQGILSPASDIAIQFGVAIYLCLSAAELRGARLLRKGYILADVVVGSDALAAQQRYFDRQVIH